MKTRSKPSKSDQPVENFQIPGLRVERRGRFISLQTHRTPEQQRHLIKRIIESRPQLLAKVEQANNELLNLVHKFNSLELLAQLWFNNSVTNPDEYKEYSFEGRPHYVEHLAALELKDPEYKLRTAEMPGRTEIEGAQELLETIFNSTVFYYASETFNPEGQPGPISRLAQLRFDTILHELAVRNPTYHSHHVDLLKELLGKDFVSQWSRRDLRFDIGKALKCVQAIEDLMMNRLLERREKAMKVASDLKGYVDQWKKTGKFVGPEDAREVANRIRNMRGKEAKRAIQSVAVSWTFYELHETCALTPGELADRAGVDLEAANAFLKHYSLRFGSTPGDYQLPQAISPLRLHPIINLGDKYFCPVPHLLIWALKPQFERLLKPDESDAQSVDTKLWQRYQKHRSDLLVQRCLTYFAKLLPRSRSYSNLHYRILEQGIDKTPELDALVLFDKYAFLIEAKAGELSPSAKRGGMLRMQSDLKELVEDPHRQALRATGYISSAQSPTFQLADGRTVSLEKKLYTEFFLVTLTLENIDVFTKELYQLKEVGIFATDELPWAISMDDLRIIAETISVPTQFIHYLKWRLYLNQTKRITAQSELDWLGYYLAEGPKALKVPDGYDYMMLETYTTQFDDFYLYEQGERTKPAPRPSQFCPPEMETLLCGLEQLHGYGYTAAAEAMLSLPFEERKLFALRAREFSFHARRGSPKEDTFEGEDVIVVLTPQPATTQDCNLLARSVAENKGKTTVVLEISRGDPTKVTAWGVHASKPGDRQNVSTL